VTYSYPLSAAPPAVVPNVTRRIVVDIEGLAKSFRVRRTWGQALRHPFRHETTSSLQDVTLQVYEGEFFGLLGPNGAGKTTLFKILSTLVLPDAGRASVWGHDIVEEERAVRGLLTPVLTNERSLNWRLTARENLELFATLHGLRGAELRERVDGVLQAVELTDTGRKPVGKFSSGMKQRLMIARALLSRPRVLLLDEPTRSLDPISARAFRTFLREEIAGRQGCTVLLATHNTEEALHLCDRVGVLNRGRLLSVGAPDELGRQLADERYEIWTRQPHHPAVAALVERGVARDPVVRDAEEAGWSRLEITIPGGLETAAQALDVLTCAGMAVARFEPVRLSLADLIERTVQRQQRSV
jgi:ABC-2 type transport system ATP-binding protein